MTGTGEAHIAFTAITRQRVRFIEAKPPLCRRADHPTQRIVHDVAKTVLRIDEVVAGIHVAVALDRERGATSGAKNAQTRFHAEPGFKRYVEYLDEYTANVSTPPLIEDIAEKLAVLLRLRRPGRYSRG